IICVLKLKICTSEEERVEICSVSKQSTALTCRRHQIPATPHSLLLFRPVLAGGPDFPASSGKFRIALLPLILNAAPSYALAASTSVSYVPNHTRCPFRSGSRISAANLPHGLLRTPL
ncbi:hypothetical protein RJ639_029513, partial [Escallonia herrerae]